MLILLSPHLLLCALCLYEPVIWAINCLLDTFKFILLSRLYPQAPDLTVSVFITSPMNLSQVRKWFIFLQFPVNLFFSAPFSSEGVPTACAAVTAILNPPHSSAHFSNQFHCLEISQSYKFFPSHYLCFCKLLFLFTWTLENSIFIDFPFSKSSSSSLYSTLWPDLFLSNINQTVLLPCFSIPFWELPA